MSSPVMYTELCDERQGQRECEMCDKIPSFSDVMFNRTDRGTLK